MVMGFVLVLVGLLGLALLPLIEPVWDNYNLYVFLGTVSSMMVVIGLLLL